MKQLLRAEPQICAGAQAVREQHCRHSQGSEPGHDKAGVAQLDMGPGINLLGLYCRVWETALVTLLSHSAHFAVAMLRGQIVLLLFVTTAHLKYSFNEAFHGFL